MLVSLGAAGFSILTVELAAMLAKADVQSDPAQFVRGLVGANGFLEAGTIIQSDKRVDGTATGLGFYAHVWVIAGLAASVLAISRFMSSHGLMDRSDG